MSRDDLYWARVAYEDDPTQYKVRPVLALDDNNALILGAKITSALPRNVSWENDYPLIDWQEAGLRHQSTVRLNHIQEIQPINYIGHLSQRDIDNINILLNN